MEADDGVRCISSSMVQAAATQEAENQRVELTPWDLHLLLVDPIQKGLLFLKPQTENNFVIHHLKTSLSHTLHYFPPLAGRLITTEHDDNTISFFIDCNNAGALFIHAEADGITISDIVKPVYVPFIVHSFFPPNGVKNYEAGVSNPLLGVQVTQLVNGFFVGVTINHSVADGTSFWHFFNSWSEISRGNNSFRLSKSPVFQRQFIDCINYPIRIPQSVVNQFHEDLILPPLRKKGFPFLKAKHCKTQSKSQC
ncbi:hypothetical protein REPUB_Repub10bG0141800 [Reevesia pubescens]